MDMPLEERRKPLSECTQPGVRDPWTPHHHQPTELLLDRY